MKTPKEDLQALYNSFRTWQNKHMPKKSCSMEEIKEFSPLYDESLVRILHARIETLKKEYLYAKEQEKKAWALIDEAVDIFNN